MDIRLKIVTSSLDVKGGAHRVILKIARHFDAPVHCFNYAPEKTHEGYGDIEVITPKKTLGRMPIARKALENIESFNYFYNLKLEDYDVVNAHMSPSEWVRNRNSPVLWYCYSPFRLGYDLYDWKLKQLKFAQRIQFKTWIATFRHLESRTVPKIEYLFTVSKNAEERIERYLGRKSEVLYPGIEVHQFRCREYEKFFFYPSRIDPAKNFEYVINAFKIFSRKNRGWKLVIAGSIADYYGQDYLEKLKSMCDESIIIETNISDERMFDLYSRCYSVPFSAVDEDLGLVPLEAFASSKPVIAYNEGGTRETVADGVDGFLVNSPEEMALKMELLAKNPDLCEKMGKAGRKKVQEYFTWDNFLKRFEEKAGEMVNGKTGGG